MSKTLSVFICRCTLLVVIIELLRDLIHTHGTVAGEDCCVRNKKKNPRNRIVWIVTDGATDITALKKVLWQIWMKTQKYS